MFIWSYVKRTIEEVFLEIEKKEITIILIFVLNFTVVKMEVEADNLQTEQIKEEALFGVLDIILLLGLIAVGAWWLLKKQKKQDSFSTPTKSYTIQ